MLLQLPDLLTSEEVAHAQRLLQEAPWVDGRKGTGELARQVKNNEQLDHDGEVARTIREMVLRGLDRSPTFFSAVLPKKVFPPRVNRYGGDTNCYGNHIDGAVRYMPGSRQSLRTDVSCTVFLNNPSDYDGGELTIADTYGEHTVKLAAGYAVLYPGTSLHQVKPVTRGQRLASFFWVESLVRSDEQRRMLYELDMNLLALRRRHGDSAESTALTGVYHNMLRMWADT
ncbi:MAG: Fe2+-dependent dioxygenase [Rhodoferax sp.]|nr:Fe2+-dependent dioxygenase [Rhodoferax sp.]